MKTRTIRLTALIALAAFAACAAPKTKQIIINSDPQGAQILIDGEVIGQTPMKRDMKFKDVKKERHLIQVRKDGFKTQERYFYYRDNDNVLFQLEPHGR